MYTYFIVMFIISVAIGLLLALTSLLFTDRHGKPRYRVKLIFKWYDFWVGFFWDSKKKILYFFPIPMFGMVIENRSNSIEL